MTEELQPVSDPIICFALEVNAHSCLAEAVISSSSDIRKKTLTTPEGRKKLIRKRAAVPLPTAHAIQKGFPSLFSNPKAIVLRKY